MCEIKPKTVDKILAAGTLVVFGIVVLLFSYLLESTIPSFESEIDQKAYQIEE